MTSHSLQATSHSLQAPFVAGAPGPPACRPCGYMIQTEEDEDMFYPAPDHEPDDLGDLMQEMRDGAAWVEGLAMDCELPMGPPALPAAAAAADAAVVLRSSGATAQPPSGLHATSGSLQALVDFGQRQQEVGAEQQQAAAEAERQRAERERSAAPLQPSMAAKLMHPGAAHGGGGATTGLPLGLSAPMIPVWGGYTSGLGCEGESDPQLLPQLTAGGGGMTARGGAPDFCAGAPGAACPWPPPPMPYYCGPSSAPSPPPMAGNAAAAAFYGMTPQPGSSGFAGFQRPPSTFYQSHLPQMMQQPQVQAQGQQELGGYSVPQMLPGMAQQQQQGRHPYSALPLQLIPNPVHQQQQQQPDSSGDASDGTKLRQRTSFDSNESGSNGSAGGCGSCHRGSRPHPDLQLLPLVPTSQAQAQMCSVPALAAFDQAAVVDGAACCAAAAPRGASRASGASYCDAPSESSDNEDMGGSLMARQNSQAQVVPDVGFLPGQHPHQPFQPTMLLPPAQHLVVPGPPAASMAADSSVYGGFPPLPSDLSMYYDSPAAQTARMARQASLERYRLKKARRGTGKKIRYQARKVNADKRPRIKGRFIKAGEEAGILAAAAAAAEAAGGGAPAAAAACGPQA